MIYRSKAPLRIGLAGGGTDVPPYCDEHTGYVLNASLNMFVHCTLELTSNKKIEFSSGDLNQRVSYDSSTILPFDGKFDLHKAVYNRIVSEYVRIPMSFKLFSYSEAPSGSGLGGSSTLVVAIIKAFSECLDLSFGVYDIARLAYIVERKDLGWKGGMQDQYAATFGGFNFMEFSKESRVVVNPLSLKNWIINEFEAHCFMAFTGISRSSSEIIDSHSQSILKKDRYITTQMHNLKKDAILMKKSILSGNITEVASILDNSWHSKKSLSSLITNPLIDKVIKAAKLAGAMACKVSGAGGGGFVLIIVEPTLKASVMNTIEEKGMKCMNITFSNKGVQSWRLD